MEKKNYKNAHFVKFYTGLTYILNRDEIFFLMHIIEIDYFRNNYYPVAWNKPEYMKRMKMPRYTFDRCVKNLLKLELITRNSHSSGNRVSYGINAPVYNRLVEILSATFNYHALEEFFQKRIKEQKRPIFSITEEEINALKKE